MTALTDVQDDFTSAMLDVVAAQLPELGGRNSAATADPAPFVSAYVGGGPPPTRRITAQAFQPQAAGYGYGYFL